MILSRLTLGVIMVWKTMPMAVLPSSGIMVPVWSIPHSSLIRQLKTGLPGFIPSVQLTVHSPLKTVSPPHSMQTPQPTTHIRYGTILTDKPVFTMCTSVSLTLARGKNSKDTPWISNNIYTFRGPVHRDSAEGDRKARPLGPGERVVEDLAASFVDPARRDFRLKAGSPAIDAGVDLGAAVPTDIEGTRRPRGKGWDLGAYASK